MCDWPLVFPPAKKEGRGISVQQGTIIHDTFRNQSLHIIIGFTTKGIIFFHAWFSPIQCSFLGRSLPYLPLCLHFTDKIFIYLQSWIYSSLHRFIWNQHSDQLPVGLLAQLVERINFSVLFRANSTKRKIILNFPSKLSDLKSDFTPTQGYLNPALNNPILD